MTARWMCLGMASVLALGCSRGAAPVVPRVGGGLTVQGKDSAADASGSVELPEDFPADVPLYLGATIDSLTTGHNNFFVVASTPDPLDKVSGFFKEKLNQNGWKEETTSPQPGGGFMTAKKARVTCGLTLAAIGKGTQLQMTVASEK